MKKFTEKLIERTLAFFSLAESLMTTMFIGSKALPVPIAVRNNDYQPLQHERYYR